MQGSETTAAPNGYLQVRTSTASEALPVAGARIVISERAQNGVPGQVLYVANTDAGGLSPAFNLPAPPRALAEQPGMGTPYHEYEMRVQMPRFYPVLFEGIPIFDGVTSTQPVSLTPLPAGTKAPQEQVFPPYSSLL